MPCSFRLRTKDPDGNWQDLEFEELLKEDGPKNTIQDFSFGDMDQLLGLQPDGEGGFSLTARSRDGALYNPDFSDLFDEEGDQLLDGTVYTEVERQVEEVTVGEEPNTVTIERMTSVTFEGPGGGKLTLQFNNPPV